jgi:hypothetical protein
MQITKKKEERAKQNEKPTVSQKASGAEQGKEALADMGK